MKVAEEEREEIQVPRNQDQDQEIIEEKENVIHLYQVEAGLLKEADHMTGGARTKIQLMKNLKMFLKEKKRQEKTWERN